MEFFIITVLCLFFFLIGVYITHRWIEPRLKEMPDTYSKIIEEIKSQFHE